MQAACWLVHPKGGPETALLCLSGKSMMAVLEVTCRYTSSACMLSVHFMCMGSQLVLANLQPKSTPKHISFLIFLSQVSFLLFELMAVTTLLAGTLSALQIGVYQSLWRGYLLAM